MQQFYESRRIKLVHYPIHDFNEADLTAKLFEGTQVLNHMISDEGLKVYVHCTAGMGRAPAVAVVYLSLFKPELDYGASSIEIGMDLPGRVDAFIKRHRSVSVPNMRAVRNAIKEAQIQGLT